MYWPKYVPVAERRAKARKKMEKLRKKGMDIQPVEIEGRAIARSFWGKGWCDHLESFSDFANRLPRGRSYARNGSVCHLDIQAGRIEAMVSGTRMYNISIGIKKLKPAAWKGIRKLCSGQIGSMLELLQGKLSNEVMVIVSDRRDGLFPQPNEIDLNCSCPDWAIMCKHVAAALYGVGHRLDERPELLFLLRDVDAEELIAAEMALPDAAPAADALADDALGDIFGIDLDTEAEAPPAEKPEKAKRKAKAKSKAKPKPKAKPKAKAKKATKPKAKKASKPKDAKKPKLRLLEKPAQAASKAPAPTPKKGKKRKAKAASEPIGSTAASVARLRKRLGLSVAAFARKIGVAPASVYRWESTRGPLKIQARPLKALEALDPEKP